MESKDMFILIMVAGLAILLYAYWHFIGSKKEVKDHDSDNNKEEKVQKCDGNICSY
jgi:hypothetical protein